MNTSSGKLLKRGDCLFGSWHWKMSYPNALMVIILQITKQRKGLIAERLIKILYIIHGREGEIEHGEMSEPFEKGFFAAAGYVNGGVVTHDHITAFAPNIPGHFIEVDNMGMMHPDERGKSLQLSFYFF